MNRSRILPSALMILLSTGAGLDLARADPVQQIGTPTTATNTSGSSACSAVVNAGAAGLAARIQADDVTVVMPQPINRLSCLSNIFGGVGLDLVTSLLSPSKILGTIENQLANQVCSAAQSAWSNTLGSASCGLTLTGFNLGFGFGLGGGLACPQLSFGGGGPSLGGLGSNLNGQQAYGVYFQGTHGRPTGYPVIESGGLY